MLFSAIAICRFSYAVAFSVTFEVCHRNSKICLPPTGRDVVHLRFPFLVCGRRPCHNLLRPAAAPFSSSHAGFTSQRKHPTQRLNLDRPRRRRGAIHAARATNNLILPVLSSNCQSDNVSSSEDDQIAGSSKVTQYTIDDSICPPTDSATLKGIVKKHIDTLPKYLESKPIAQFNTDAFSEALAFVLEFGKMNKQHRMENESKIGVILDSGCGTGKSTTILGERHPDCAVIGIESLVRLSRNKGYREQYSDAENENDEAQSLPTNVIFIRADLIDFWHLCVISSKWQTHVYVRMNYLLYPNPYPKKSRLKNRFYAHPGFPLLMLTVTTGRGDDAQIIVRSNWKTYLDEFATAVKVWEECGFDLKHTRNVITGRRDEAIDRISFVSDKIRQTRWTVNGPSRISCEQSPMTNFESKYLQCGEPVYEIALNRTHKC